MPVARSRGQSSLPATVLNPGLLLFALVHCACELLGDSPASNSHLTVGAVEFQTQATTSGFFFFLNGFHIVSVGWQGVLLLRHLTNLCISRFYFVINDQIPDRKKNLRGGGLFWLTVSALSRT